MGYFYFTYTAPAAVFSQVHARGDSMGKAALDLLPFLVFLPSLLFWGIHSEIALTKYPLIMVTALSEAV